MTDINIQIAILSAFVGILTGWWWGRNFVRKEVKEIVEKNLKLEACNAVWRELTDNLSQAFVNKIEKLQSELNHAEDEKRILEKELEKVMP